ncbi:MAG: hypothetical protein LBG97_02930 [Coriobacteriales bacterium]|jgi:magnesium-transporting ATPase (P-type)|nr:hypothetical protein [Coriobacteriales bacterium]
MITNKGSQQDQQDPKGQNVVKGGIRQAILMTLALVLAIYSAPVMSFASENCGSQLALVLPQLETKDLTFDAAKNCFVLGEPQGAALKTVVDTQTPLFAPSDMSGWSLINIIFSVIIVILAAITGFRFYKHKESQSQDEQKIGSTRRPIVLIAAIVVAFVSVGVVVVTSEFDHRMLIFDIWSVDLALKVVLCAFLVGYVVKKDKTG